MENRNKAVCPGNEEVAAYLLNKRQELAQSAKGISENMDMTLSKAYSNICNCKTPIKTLRDLSQIKGVGKWILKQMKGFFETDSGSSENDELTKKGNKKKGPRRYIPQKNSVAYALLISLFRGTENGNEFMCKQELIDAAETSGLSRVPIAPEKAKGKAGHFGSSPRDWYSGWNCMKTLISRGLVVKSSCPAKYMLTEEGKEVARECLLRSNINDANKSLDGVEGCPNFNQRKKSRVDVQGDPDVECINGASVGNAAVINLKKPKISIDVPTEYLDKFVSMGFSREQIIRAFSEVKETSQRKEISSLWPSVLCRLREDDIYGSTSVPKSMTDDHHSMPSSDQHSSGQAGLYAGENIQPQDIAASSNQKSTLHDFARRSCNLKACSSTDYAVSKLNVRGSEPKPNTLAMPPLAFGENFGDVYEVVLILDNREQFATQGSRSRKIIENICSQFQIQIEVRRLPVGDGIWVARHKYLGSEYVLDFIVERKKVEDLRHSIRDNRYRDQKMRLVRCGLKKMIYLVEGDPNSSEAAESIKTACFTTEILEGFDVQRTSGLADTLKKYGYLTRSINQYYKSLDSEQKFAGVCPPFDEFIRTCEELDKMTVSDVFAVQLMQVPQVTEDIALAVLDMYPTLLSLARAYSLLDGDVFAQEEMLKRQSNNLINGSASKNIFYLVWGT
ncbi:crossover junction endonuclease MUS81 isoform X1 [Sesamum indicum]|uniref:Crossover junction endonuclease MUS81 n=1 Tax=Sesamum indicum TaxID=4182 RepID=A0A6I9TX54_SESIN|nr:crossover junction endonuclease MUS81 isoform X1 [Sesamum indicum]